MELRFFKRFLSTYHMTSISLWHDDIILIIYKQSKQIIRDFYSDRNKQETTHSDGASERNKSIKVAIMVDEEHMYRSLSSPPCGKAEEQSPPPCWWVASSCYFISRTRGSRSVAKMIVNAITLSSANVNVWTLKERSRLIKATLQRWHIILLCTSDSIYFIYSASASRSVAFSFFVQRSEEKLYISNDFWGAQ